MLEAESEVVEPSLREKILLVQSDTQMSGLDLEGARIFAQHGRYRTYAKGDYLSHIGDEQRFVHLLLEGAVRVTTDKGKSFAISAPGGLGWPSLLTGRPAIEAVATELSVALEFDGDTIMDFFEMNFSMMRNAIRLTASETLRRRSGLPVKPGSDVGGELGEYPESPATLAQKVIEIRDTGLFRDQNAEAGAALARADTEMRFDEGAVLWRVGDVADHGLRIRYGHVRCTAPDGRSAVVGPGYTMGMLDVMALVDRGYDATCETRVVAYRTPASAFLSVLEDHHEVALSLLRILTLTGFLAED